MSDDVLLFTLSNVGVPTAIAFFVLYRVNVQLDKLTEAIYTLAVKLEKQKGGS